MGLNLVYEDGNSPLYETEIQGLKIQAIATQSQLDEHEQLNIEKALRWIFKSKFKQDKILSEAFIKSIHKRMLGDVWKWGGEYRKTDKNIGSSWIHVSSQISILLDDVKTWIKFESYPAKEIAIRFKHRLVNIHPFSNGNGRHSRIMADIIMESIFNDEAFKWNNSNMLKPDDTRKRYIESIREADKGNIQSLLYFAEG
jgi:Fic-DOC domain mobile mystery protein B